MPVSASKRSSSSRKRAPQRPVQSLSAGFTTGELSIRKTVVPTQTGMLSHTDLLYYPANPRVYSVVHLGDEDPTQAEIEEELQKMEHVRDLALDIKSHGGLIEPLYVKDGSLEVLEGNSRLAAYRLLSKKDPVTWARIRCTLLPADVSDSTVSALLSQLHLKGKRDWLPYEQAGHVYRRFRRDKVPLKELAVETGLGEGKLRQYIDAYKLMAERKDTKRANWSYYFEIVRSKTIAKARESRADFIDVVMGKVGSDIPTAQDLRDKLPTICKSSKALARFLSDEKSFDTAFEEARDGEGAQKQLNKLQNFRGWIAEKDVRDALVSQKPANRKKARFELEQIQGIVGAMLKRLAT